MNKTNRRGIAMPVIAILLMTINFTRLTNSECIRAIHVVTLLIIGFAAGVLVMNLMTIYKNNKISE